jgi:hypothetical protein
MSGVGIGLSIGIGALTTAGAAGGAKWLWDNVNKDEREAVGKAAGQQVSGEEAARKEMILAQAKQARALGGYQAAGGDALAQQRALAGLDGPEAQQAAISQLEQSPQFQAMLQQSEEAMLANASATGGLRGGNTQAALAQLRPALLSQIIEAQYARLGGLSSMGYGAASQVGQGALGIGQQQAGIQQNIGAIRAGSTLGQSALLTQGRQQLLNTGASLIGGGAQLAMGAPPTAFAGMGQQPAASSGPASYGYGDVSMVPPQGAY